MKWFRSNLKTGSRLALVALALQFALSFGHFHGLAAQPSQSGLAQSEGSYASRSNDQDNDTAADV